MTASPKDKCHKDLERRILATELKPGETLDEVSLCDEYGISRTPLREVFHRLAGQGLLSLAPNRGAKVASMDLPILRVFFKTAPSVYVAIARLAAQHRSSAQLVELRAAQAAFRAAIKAGDVDGSALANHQFHHIIGQMAANPYLVAALGRLLVDHTRLSQTFYSPESKGERDLVVTAVEQHEAMIDAIENKDPEGVVLATRAHWDLSSDAIERFVRPDPVLLEDVNEV